MVHVYSTALSRCQRNLANTLTSFNFECIGTERTDDEIVIGKFGARLHSNQVNYILLNLNE